MSLSIALTHVYAWPEVRRGGERYMHELAAALSDAGHHVTILSTARRPGRARLLGVDVRYVRRRDRLLARRFGELGGEVAFGIQALARLGLRRLDVWHALGAADAAAATLVSKVRGVRSVYTDLGVPERSWREQRGDRRFHRSVTRSVDTYLVLSRAAAEHLRRDYGRDPIVLGGGVDMRAFHPAERRHPTPALLFPAPASEPRKNLKTLLEAVALLRTRHPRLELWLAGPDDPSAVVGAAPAPAREAAVALGVGTLEELAERYARAWVTVLPSHGEAFGLVVLESLASGTPVVTLSEGAPAELVSDRVGATSALEASALADACARALELATEASTVEACRAAAEPHDWRRGIVPRMEAVYRGEAPVSWSGRSPDDAKRSSQT